MSKQPIPRIIITETSTFQRLDELSWDRLMQILKEEVIKDTTNKVVVELDPNE